MAQVAPVRPIVTCKRGVKTPEYRMKGCSNGINQKGWQIGQLILSKQVVYFLGQWTGGEIFIF